MLVFMDTALQHRILTDDLVTNLSHLDHVRGALAVFGGNSE